MALGVAVNHGMRVLVAVGVAVAAGRREGASTSNETSSKNMPQTVPTPSLKTPKWRLIVQPA